MTRDYAQSCFVDMPYGKKVDPATGVEIDFDQIFERAILPAVDAAGLQCIRGDREETGEIIHEAMFARLLLCDYVIADLTTANANVFYELGVRHTARPYTTIPIYAPLSGLPFDVNMIRAVPYRLKWDAKSKKKGRTSKLTRKAAAALQKALVERIEAAKRPPVAKDSPLFQFFDDLEPVELSHDVTDVFQREVRVSEEFQAKLDRALGAAGEERLARVRALQAELADPAGSLGAVQGEILLRLLLTYRGLSAWEDMVGLHEHMPGNVQESVVVRQQVALALNRRAEKQDGFRASSADRRRAVRILEDLLKERGASAETYGILGRVHKGLYQAAQAAKKKEAVGHLDAAIDAYTAGFEAEPVDFYPGVNAVNLLAQRGTKAADREVERLVPLVTFAVARRGGLDSPDYWDRATALELALIGGDDRGAREALPRVLAKVTAPWMAETTANNLEMVLGARRRRKGMKNTALRQCVKALRKKQAELEK